MATATTTPPRKPRTAGPAAPTTFRLLLAIGGTAYWVRPITSALHAQAFRLRRADGQGEHYVTQDEHGHHCDCGDFTWGATRAGGRPASTSGPSWPRGCSTAPRRPRRRRRAGSGTSSTRPDRHRPRESTPRGRPSPRRTPRRPHR